VNICRHIGHTAKRFDSGYAICDRCGAHEFYDAERFDWEWYSAIYRVYARLWNWREDFRHWWAYRYTERCSECRKVLVWRGFRLRYHDHNLPF